MGKSPCPQVQCLAEDMRGFCSSRRSRQGAMAGTA